MKKEPLIQRRLYFLGMRLYRESKAKKAIPTPLQSPKENGKNKSKRKKKPVSHSRSGRAIRKKRNTSSSEDEASGEESDKSTEVQVLFILVPPDGFTVFREMRSYPQFIHSDALKLNAFSYHVGLKKGAETSGKFFPTPGLGTQ